MSHTSSPALRDIGWSPDRIEIGQVSVRHEPDGARGRALRDGRRGKAACYRQGGSLRGRLEKCSSIHRPILDVALWPRTTDGQPAQSANL